MPRLSTRSLPCFVGLLALTAGGIACSSDDHFSSVTLPPALQITISPAASTSLVTDTIAASDAVKLSVNATSLSRPIPTPAGVVWSTSNASVAVVDSTGRVTPIGFGTAQIEAKLGAASATATIVVARKVQSIGLNPTTVTAVVGDTLTMTASALDATGILVPGTAYNFSVADPSVASVTKTGLRTASIIPLKAGALSIGVSAGGMAATLTGTMQARDFITSAVQGAPQGSLTLSAGEDATCGLLPFGRGYCFGRAPLIGVAKDSSCFNDQTGGLTGCTLVPLRIAAALNLVSVTVGDSVACGVTSDNKGYCWGTQTYGQLGNGVASTGSSATPNLVIGAVSRSAVALNRISAGSNHACGLNPQGAALCWGQDFFGQLGNGDGLFLHSTTPIPVTGGFTFSAISAGRTHNCALRASDGIAMCWGDNAKGQVGNGTTVGIADGPVAVSGAPAFVQIAAGGFHSCGLTSQGTVFCWGSNLFGQLGRNSTDTSSSGTAAQVSGTYKALSAGRYSTCAITTAGAAVCWGKNDYGQIGAPGAPNMFIAPTAVAGGRTDFTAVTVGARHACAIAAAGVYCWGSNVVGALGNELQAMIQFTPTKTATPQ